MKQYDFLIIGAGIFGVATAVELYKRKYSVAVLNPGKIPHPLAESTDISKIIRMEYGTDVEYMANGDRIITDVA
jgi:glycine/D-amino acid oxidase-like deaminating enzyme